MSRRAARALLCLVLLLFLLPSPAAESPRIALVIGNAAYSSAPLANPVNDADLVSDTLREVGFQVLQHNDVSQKSMKLAIREFGDALLNAGADAVGLFYYSGHGIQVDGRNYMIPVNADIRRESDIDIEGVAADIVLGTMEFARNRLNLVIMDACRNNPYARSFRSATRGLARMDATKGTLIAYSTSPGQVAVDGEGRNSPYTLALSNAMRQPRLPVEQVFKRVRRKVMAETGNLQVPWESSSLTGDFYFGGAPAEVAASPVSAPAASEPSNAEVLFWESIKDSGDPAAFRAYLEQFPQGVFSGLARIRSRQGEAESRPRGGATATASSASRVEPAQPSAGRPQSGESGVSLSVPDDIDAGAEIKIAWVGPDQDKDFITIVVADAERGTYGPYAYTRRGSPLKLTAPDRPGDYEVRYLAGQGGATLGATPIEVRAVTATLDAPTDLDAGSEIRVSWEGPGNKKDFITIVERGADEGTYGKYVYSRSGSPLKLTAPDEPGDYEIRYLTGQSRMTLASLPVQVRGVAASLEAPATAPAGAEVRVGWEGPGNKKDFLTIVEQGADEGLYGKYAYTRGGSPLKLTAPDEPGDYEIRYLAGQSRATLVSVPIRVIPVTATLVAPADAEAGSEVRIEWEGPDNAKDFVTFVEADADAGVYGKYAYTRKGNPLKLEAPDDPGDYEIRYVTGQTRSTLASMPIEVLDVGASLEAPEQVSAGSKFTVNWTGPGNKRDFITIVESGAEEGKYGPRAYARNGNPLKLLAPAEGGSYEIRYLTGQARRTLARRAVSVE